MKLVKNIIVKSALLVIQLNIGILFAYFFYLLFFVDTTQPIQEYDTLSNFYKTLWQGLNKMLVLVKGLF